MTIDGVSTSQHGSIVDILATVDLGPHRLFPYSIPCNTGDFTKGLRAGRAGGPGD